MATTIEVSSKAVVLLWRLLIDRTGPQSSVEVRRATGLASNTALKRALYELEEENVIRIEGVIE